MASEASIVCDMLAKLPAPEFPCHVPDGESGDIRVSTFELKHEHIGMQNLRYYRDGNLLCCLRPGTYKRITRKIDPKPTWGPEREVLMSNTPLEARTNQLPLKMGRGYVLITGLGLGIVPTLLAQKKSVIEITVVEQSDDVIKLVEPHMPGKVKVVKGDAFTFKPQRKYDFVWHDIWHDIDSNNLKQMEELRVIYAPYAKQQGCWTEQEIRKNKLRGV